MGTFIFGSKFESVGKPGDAARQLTKGDQAGRTQNSVFWYAEAAVCDKVYFGAAGRQLSSKNCNP